MNRKLNNYDLSGEYGIGYTSNDNTIFYFDLEDYDKIKDYTWRCDRGRYILTTYSANNKTQWVYLHKLIINADSDTVVDHINRNKCDNRKHNLRCCTSQKNSFNSSKRLTNKTGIIGVCWKTDKNKWKSYITLNGKQKHLGYFNDIEDAIKARLKAEAKYFGIFSPQMDLFDKYGVNLNE